MIDPNTKLDIGTLWLEGCNTSLRPESISERQYVWGINVDNSRGEVSTREGFTQIFQSVAGEVQMLAHFRDADNNDWVVAAANGVIYAALHPFTDLMIISEDQGITLNPDAPFYTHKVVQRGACRVTQENGRGETKKIKTERYLVISDGGKNPPVYFDGSRLRQSDPENFGIPKCSWMAYCKNRLWVWDTLNECLKFSDINNPLTFYTVGFLAQGGGYNIDSPCHGMIAAPDGSGDLLVFEKEKTWVFRTSLDITTESDWKAAPGFQKVLFPHVGCMAGKSFTYHYGDLWWWSHRGLMSLRRAANTLKDDELNPTDLEMTRSRESFGNGSNAVCGVSHDNYLLISTPRGDIWAKNNSPASLLNSDTPPAWMGIWTGLRVKEFCTFVSRQGNQRWTMAISADFDGKNRIWRLFNGTHFDNGQPIKCFAEFRAHPTAGLYTRKRFGNVASKVHNVWGDVSLSAFYRGTRGSWKKIMDTLIRAAEQLDGNAEPVTQSRDITTPEVTHRSSCNCGEESSLTDNVDGAFQVMFSWTGQLSMGSYQIVAYEDVQDFNGRCPKPETEPTTIHTCDPIDYTYQPAYIEQVNNRSTITFTSCRTRCLPYKSTKNPIVEQDTTWTVISTGNTLNPSEEDILKVVACKPDETPTREYTSTQTVTVFCLDGSGESVTKTATATSTISMSAAEEEAQAIARADAEAELVCSWTATKSFTAKCPTNQFGNVITKSATYTSTISMEDAVATAKELAQTAAEAELSCIPLPNDKFNLGGENSLNSGLDPSVPTMGSFSRVDYLGRPATPWSGGSGPNGRVLSSAGFSVVGTGWIAGEFTSYNGIARTNLARVNDAGALDTSKPDYFRTPSGFPADSNVINQHFEGADGFIAVTGLIRSFNGTRLSTINPSRVNPATYLLFNPNNNSIVSVGGYGSGIAGQMEGGAILYADNFNNRYLGYNTQFVRVFQNGTRDTNFIANYDTMGPLTDTGRGFVTACAVDTRRMLIYVAGDFTRWGGISVPSGIARLRWDGTLDTSFIVTGVRFNPQPREIWGSLNPIYNTNTPDGVDAIFASVTINGTNVKTTVRINTGGSVDQLFRAPAGTVPLRAKPQPNPNIIFVRNQSGEDFRVDPPGTNISAWLTSSASTQTVVLARKHILMLDINTGQPIYAFNSDPNFVPPTGADYDHLNPGIITGPITGVR